MSSKIAPLELVKILRILHCTSFSSCFLDKPKKLPSLIIDNVTCATNPIVNRIVTIGPNLFKIILNIKLILNDGNYSKFNTYLPHLGFKIKKSSVKKKIYFITTMQA
jgi:hypothetical protein